MLTLGLMNLLNSVYTEISEDEKAKASAEQKAEADKLAEAETAKLAEAEAAELARQEEEKVPISDLRKVRSEAAGYRKQLRELEAKVDASTKAQEKSAKEAEIEKLDGVAQADARAAEATKRLAEAEASRASLEARLDAQVRSEAVYRAAIAAGFQQGEDATAMIDLAQLEIIDGKVDIDEVDELVKTLADSRPYLLKEADAPGAPIGPTNPGNKILPGFRATDAGSIKQLKAASAQAQAKGDVAGATRLYNLAWEKEHGIKSG